MNSSDQPKSKLRRDAGRYVVAGSKPWNRATFDTRLAALPGEWHFVLSPDELSAMLAGIGSVDYVFFLHWSWIVPESIWGHHECVVFHMTDLPFGRGGSPLQNLIMRGITRTKLSALRMDAGIDTGPIYVKCDLDLEGTAREIYARASDLSAEMAAEIIATQPTPVVQAGEPTVFSRRKPEQSRLEGIASLDTLHDTIRMLDADGYPHAFIEHDGLRIEFTGSVRGDNHVSADVKITLIEEKKP